MASNPWFGALDHLPTSRINGIIEALILQGKLKYSDGKYRTIVPIDGITEKSLDSCGVFVKEDNTIEVHTADIKSSYGRNHGKKLFDDDLFEDDSELFSRLKALRKRLADARGVPPYVIFSDKTLIEIVKLRPKNSDEMRLCSGVGIKKLELYGDYFLNEINGK